MDTFLSTPNASCKIWNTQLVQVDQQIQIVLVTIYINFFWTRIIILLTIKVEILMLIKWSYSPSLPHSCW